MKNIFKEIDQARFGMMFQDETSCLEYLAGEKWKDGYACRKCGHTNYCRGKTLFSRRCTKCKHEESARAHTIFHRCKIPLADAFEIAFRVCNNPHISSYTLAREMDLRQMTCWKFKRKISECIENKGDFKFIP